MTDVGLHYFLLDGEAHCPTTQQFSCRILAVENNQTRNDLSKYRK